MSYFRNHRLKHLKDKSPTLEHWRPLFDGTYEISCLGRCRRARPGRGTRVGKMMKPTATKDGYLFWILCVHGEYIRPVMVATHVARRFLGKKKEGMEVNHKDFNIRNNNWKNLEYLSHADNIAYSKDRGRYSTCQLGLRNGNAKLTREVANKIFTLYKSGRFSQTHVGKMFGVSHRTVGLIAAGDHWTRRGTNGLL